MTSSAVLVTAILAGALSGPGGEPQTWVAEAISWGANQKRVDLPFAKCANAVYYSTPYLRVAMAARKAKPEGRELDPASVPEELTAPELHVAAWMLGLGDGRGLIGMAPATAMTLVVAGEHMKPSSIETRAIPMSAAELGGDMRRFEGRELRAVFPLSQPIPAEAHLIVEYSWNANGDTKRTQRKCKLELEKTKW